MSQCSRRHIHKKDQTKAPSSSPLSSASLSSASLSSASFSSASILTRTTRTTRTTKTMTDQDLVRNPFEDVSDGEEAGFRDNDNDMAPLVASTTRRSNLEIEPALRGRKNDANDDDVRARLDRLSRRRRTDASSSCSNAKWSTVLLVVAIVLIPFLIGQFGSGGGGGGRNSNGAGGRGSGVSPNANQAGNTKLPTLSPTRGPTLSPTRGPTLIPTRGPTLTPTRGPTPSPVQDPEASSTPTTLPPTSSTPTASTPTPSAPTANSAISSDSDDEDLSACEKKQFNMTIDAFYQPFNTTPDIKSCVVEDEACKCVNPTVGARRSNTDKYPNDKEDWKDAFKAMKKVAKQAKADFGTVDVVLVGDSITEAWLGTGMNKTKTKYAEHAEIFQELFTKAGGSEINGVPLGISGDTCANVMYRLTHNQLQKLKTKVFWLLIGTNDFSALQCSSDAVTAGNIAIVQQLQKLRPKARVVINSILPRDSAYMDLIRQTNKRLNCYAQQTENVDYFDATSIFYDDAKEELQHLPDELHPDAEGARAWGKQIVQRVEEILKE